MQEEKRTEFINSLRLMADTLENPDLRLPTWANSLSPVYVFARTAEEIKAWAKTLGAIEKIYGDDDSSYNFSIRGNLGTLQVQVFTERELVCERIVVGSEEIEVTERDPSYEVPMITHTVVKEIVEWNCHSLLADD